MSSLVEKKVVHAFSGSYLTLYIMLNLMAAGHQLFTKNSRISSTVKQGAADERCVKGTGKLEAQM